MTAPAGAGRQPDKVSVFWRIVSGLFRAVNPPACYKRGRKKRALRRRGRDLRRATGWGFPSRIWLWSTKNRATTPLSGQKIPAARRPVLPTPRAQVCRPPMLETRTASC